MHNAPGASHGRRLNPAGAMHQRLIRGNAIGKPGYTGEGLRDASYSLKMKWRLSRHIPHAGQPLPSEGTGKLHAQECLDKEIPPKKQPDN
jgi:hypothetical protein